MIYWLHLRISNAKTKIPLKSECHFLYGGVFENSHTRNPPLFGVTWESSAQERDNNHNTWILFIDFSNMETCRLLTV